MIRILFLLSLVLGQSLFAQNLKTEAILIQAEKNINSGFPEKAIYPLSLLNTTKEDLSVRTKALELLGNLYYSQGLFSDGLPYFETLAQLDPQSIGALRLAEWYYLKAEDVAKAKYWLLPLQENTNLNTRDRFLFSFLKKKIVFTLWDLKKWELTDSNISALVKDYDDLWIGTWNGGLVRFSTVTNQATTFRNGAYHANLTTIRCIAVDDWFVYIGGFEGLWRYNKVSQHWLKIEPPEGFPLERIQDIQILDGRLIVATLGAGIWEWTKGKWESWSALGWTGKNVNKVLPYKEGYLVSTMDSGGWFFSTKTATLQKLSQIYPGINSKNITFLFPDGEDLWAGTYGDGLYMWSSQKKSWHHWSVAQGNLLDDYVLTGTKTSRGFIFGTLGKGSMYYSKKKNILLVWDPIKLGGPGDIGVVESVDNKILLGTLGEGLVMLDEEAYEAQLP